MGGSTRCQLRELGRIKARIITVLHHSLIPIVSGFEIVRIVGFLVSDHMRR